MVPQLRKPEVLNTAAYVIGTRALGPGWRAAIWVQGCPFHCAGCVAPEWQEQRTADLVRVNDLVERILTPGITGLTISGGEPMLQADVLASLVEQVRRRRSSIDVICFTGFTMGQLIWSNDDGVSRFLAQLDVLVDGLYVEAKNDGRGLRGSTNQMVHRLTEAGRRMSYNFETAPRHLEIHIGNDRYLAAGIPPARVLAALNDL